MQLSHRPIVLFHASLERLKESRIAFENRDHVLSMYLSGVAVECILQAIAIYHGSPHDARHDLPSLRDQIKGEGAAAWSQLLALWDNGLRYLSKQGLLGYLREKKTSRRISGGPDSIIRENARRLLDAADIIHKKGLSQWVSSTRR
jgi:HEPN domain-containing protein